MEQPAEDGGYVAVCRAIETCEQDWCMAIDGFAWGCLALRWKILSLTFVTRDLTQSKNLPKKEDFGLKSAGDAP